NRGRASGVAVDFHYFQVTTVRNGKVTSSYMTDTRERALEAAAVGVGLWTKDRRLGSRSPPSDCNPNCNPNCDNGGIWDVTSATACVGETPALTNGPVQDDTRRHGLGRTLNLKVTGSIPVRPTLKAAANACFSASRRHRGSRRLQTPCKRQARCDA